MKMGRRKNDSAVLLIQILCIYAWLTVLSRVAGTDEYYSVYLLCAIGGIICLCSNLKNGSGMCREGIKDRRILLFLQVTAVLLSTAVALANYVLFEPLSVLENLFDLICVLLGGYCVFYNILTGCFRHFPVSVYLKQRISPIWVFLFVFASIAAIDLLYLRFCLYPGVLTTDSFSTIAQIFGRQPYNNVMPFWHTVTVEPFVKLGMRLFGDINAAIALFHSVQILFMAACMGYVIVTLYQIGVPLSVITAVYAIYALVPYNIVYSVTLWKDVPFSGAAVLFVTAFYRLLKGVGRCNWLNYFVFMIGALGFSLWRTNGWYAFLATVVVMFFLLRKTQKKLLIMMTVVLILCWILINPVLDILGVSGTNFVEAFAVPMQQIARVVAEGRELTVEEHSLLSEIFWMDILGKVYNPQTVDPVKFESFRYDQVGYIMDNLGSYLKLYLGLGLRYPGDYLKAWVDETKGYWNGGYFFWTYTLNMSENSFGVYQTPGEGLVSRLYAAWFRYVEKADILQFTVSIGLYVWGLVVCFLVNVWKKREEFLLAIPILVLIVGLWLGTPVYAEFRYAYPLILSFPLILCTTVFCGPQKMDP